MAKTCDAYLADVKAIMARAAGDRQLSRAEYRRFVDEAEGEATARRLALDDEPDDNPDDKEC